MKPCNFFSAVLKYSLSPDMLCTCLLLTPSLSFIPLPPTFFMVQLQLICRKFYCVNQCNIRATGKGLHKESYTNNNCKSRIPQDQSNMQCKGSKDRVLKLVSHMQCKNSIKCILLGVAYFLFQTHSIILYYPYASS